MSLKDLRPILMINGILLGVIAVSMIFPAITDYVSGHPDWEVFAMSALIVGFIGVSLYLTNRSERPTMNLRQAFLFTAVSYFFVSAAGALPFYLSELKLSVVDAMFEAVSGLTTTGASVISGLDHAPPGILLWRALIQGLGGVGIVVLAMAVLPMLQVGGMQLFKTESSDTSEKALPKVTQLAGVVAVIFLALTALCAFCFYVAGMSGFDAIAQALPTVATGGFSTHDASFGYFNSPLIEGIAVLFMLIGSLPLILYYHAVRGNPGIFLRDAQVRAFFGIYFGVTLLLAAWLVAVKGMPLLQALRESGFAVTTIITTTGFVTTDFSAWGSFALCVLFMLMSVGGCTGSTVGGIKIFRFQVFYETVKMQLNQLLQPHGVFLARYNGRPVPDSVSASVMAFFLLFAFSFMALTILFSLFGSDYLTSMSAVLQALSNTGVGLGPTIGPCCNFSSLPDGSKWVLIVAMTLGRVELFTIYVLFLPKFWRD